MVLGSPALRCVIVSLCLASTVIADPVLVRKRPTDALIADASGVPEDDLKQMLAKVMQNKQMQQMAKDPRLVSGLMELMRDPEKMTQITQDQDLAQSLHDLVEKDPTALTQIMKEAGFEVGMSDEDVKSASMEEVHAEFLRLKKSDEDHMKRLQKNNEMRDALKTKLGAVVSNAMKDTSHVNDRLHHIHEGNSKKSVIVEQDGSLIESAKPDKLAMLEHLESIEEIETALDELAVHINKKIKSLKTQDDIELEALEDNAELRSKLKGKLQDHIKEQQKELSFAADVEDKAFDKI